MMLIDTIKAGCMIIFGVVIIYYVGKELTKLIVPKESEVENEN